MSLFLDDGDVRIYLGDAREALAEVADESVHCVATSPPFFGLRDYGTGRWEGGDPDCDHERPTTTMNVGFNERWGQGGGEKRQERKSAGQYAGECPKCGAARIDSQIGLEATPFAWADSIVEVMREARRVLRADGSLWVECGDSYAANRSYQVADSKHRDVGNGHGATVPDGMKPTDLVGAPWLLAFALRADGWYLRGAYIWEKPDAMPESVENRCTTSHSYVFHLTKSSEDAVFWTHRDGRGTRSKPTPDYRWVNRQTGEEADEAREGSEWRRVNLWRGRSYFFDRDAIREPFSDYAGGGDGGSYGANADAARTTDSGPRGSTRYLRPRPQEDAEHVQPTLDGAVPEPEVRGADGRRVLTRTTGSRSHENYGEFGHEEGRSRWPSAEGRSPRSVWRITTEASSFGLCRVCRTFWAERAPARHCGADVVAHFAVWPHDLVAKIVNAATPEAGCCADCGAPRVRWINAETRSNWQGGEEQKHAAGVYYRPNPGGGVGTDRRERETLGWQPTCGCDAPSVPAVVLDVFGGSGTTARQARAMGRHAILVELSPDYAEIAAHRLAQQGLALV